jgi:hypothetical protein
MPRCIHYALALVLLMSCTCVIARADDLAAPKKRLAEARSSVTKAKVAVMLAARKIQQEYEATAEWKKAEAAAKDAQARHAAAERVARAALGETPAFKQAVVERGQREAELNALKSAPERDEPAIAAASVALLKAVEATSRLDHAALAADPKVIETKAAADAATAGLAELRKTEVRRVEDSPAFQAAREQFRQASAGYDQAATALAQARQQQAAAQSQKDDAEIEAKRHQMFDATRR